MGKVELIRVPVSKTKNMMMTVGIDDRKHMDREHDMYFLRVYVSLRRELDKTNVNEINVIQIKRVLNRHVTFFRNDNEEVLLNSIKQILEWCENHNVNEVVFNEHEINKVSLNQVVELVNKFNVHVFLRVCLTFFT